MNVCCDCRQPRAGRGLHGRRKTARGSADRRGHLKGREARSSIENIYTEGGIKYVHHLETAVRAKALFHRDKEYVVRGEGEERNRHRRRIHWTSAAGPPLVGRSASGHRSKGARTDSEGNPHVRDDVSELVPPLRSTRRHDGYRAFFGRGIL